MDKSIRRVHPPALKAKVALEAIKEKKTIAELSALFSIHSTQITKWERSALNALQDRFSEKAVQQQQRDNELIQELYQQIGKLQVDRDWLKKRLGSLKTTYSVGVNEVRLYISSRNQPVPPIGRQAQLLGISRSSVYYQPKPVDPFVLSVTHKIDEIYIKRPFYGVRRITEQLHREGMFVNHKRVHHLMQEKGIQGLIPKKNSSKRIQTI